MGDVMKFATAGKPEEEREQIIRTEGGRDSDRAREQAAMHRSGIVATRAGSLQLRAGREHAGRHESCQNQSRSDLTELTHTPS